jgi:putative endonuclease
MKEYQYWVYFMASNTGTLYIGFTNNIGRRVLEHKQGVADGFTKKYKCHKLVYFQKFTDVNEAIKREKELKKWRREKKENLIRLNNPTWKDLSEEL